MKTIKLTRGKVAIVDDSDYESLACFKWWAVPSENRKVWYAKRWPVPSEQSAEYPWTIAMHRQIMGFPSSAVDHRDRDGLNNQRHNLRLATAQQQASNSRHRECGHLRGVYPHRRRWGAHVRFNGRLLHLGYFQTPKEAGIAYDQEAKRLFGEFAVLNFP